MEHPKYETLTNPACMYMQWSKRNQLYC